METNEELSAILDAAEEEITEILAKYGVYVGTFCDEGKQATLCIRREHPNGDIRVIERTLSSPPIEQQTVIKG